MTPDEIIAEVMARPNALYRPKDRRGPIDFCTASHMEIAHRLGVDPLQLALAVAPEVLAAVPELAEITLTKPGGAVIARFTR